MKKIAVFPGSFDPFTVGHESIVRRALMIFDEIIIAIGRNTNKTDFFPIEKRKEWIREVFKDHPNVRIMHYDGLTVDFCASVNAQYLLRGLRTSSDFEYERAIAQLNSDMNSKVESVFLLTRPEHTAINSTIIREILKHGGDARKFLPGEDQLKDRILKYAKGLEK